MIREYAKFPARPLIIVLLGVGLCASASAFAGGGRGGDSSMNPYTGDSYAYFNGGHNLGEEGMNIPWRKPVPQSSVSIKRGAPSAANPSATANGSTRRFQWVEPSGDRRADSRQGGDTR